MEFYAIVFGALALWVAFSTLKRVKRLEQDLAALRARLDTGEGPAPLPEAPSEAASDTAPDAPTPWARQPRPTVTPPPIPEPTANVANQAGSLLARLGPWLRDNWIYPAAGAALVLSGIFLVQYAVETGRLTPETRILLALVMGAALAGAGEWARRRPSAGAILPATLTGAGLVIAMAAILAALHLYDMIGPATALVALTLLSLAAILLGWLHGPMLAALGLVAGTIVPFSLGGGGTPPPALMGYFALLALAGLGIDALRRWRWVTWLAILGPMGGIILWRLAGADATALVLAMLVVTAAAMTLPFGFLAPKADGPRALGRAHPIAGVRASFVASALTAGALALLVPGWAGPIGLVILAALVALWTRQAPALADQIILPLLALPLWVALQAWEGGAVFTQFAAPRLPESAMQMQATYLLALALIAGAALLWRGAVAEVSHHAPFTLAGLILPGATLIALETTWAPSDSLGAYVWALHAMALAGLAVAFALHAAQRDGGTGPRLGSAAATAFALVALGLMLLIGQAALTVALAVLMVAAAAMDRRFDIPALGAFLVLASIAMGWRLVIDPGLSWHISEGGLLSVLLSLLATLGGPLGALWLQRGLPQVPVRRTTQVMVETGLSGSAAIAAAIALARLLPEQVGPHAILGLQASVLIALAWVQFTRARLAGLRRVRLAFGWLLALCAGAALVAGAVFPSSPVFGEWFFAGQVAGWPVFNDLALAYLLPALLLLWLGARKWLRLAGWGLATLWVATTLRHLWQGPDLRIARGIAQGELYAYTFALLVAGAVALAVALRTGRPDLRKLGLVLAGLAAGKAFLVDASELDGLLRVGAFLGLGLTLAGLAWLNGWAVARAKPATEEGTEAP